MAPNFESMGIVAIRVPSPPLPSSHPAPHHDLEKKGLEGYGWLPTLSSHKYNKVLSPYCGTSLFSFPLVDIYI